MIVVYTVQRDVLIRCLLQLPPFSGQSVKFFFHIECSLNDHDFLVRELLLTALFVHFLHILI